jgi:hypothetical protein
MSGRPAAQAPVAAARAALVLSTRTHFFHEADVALLATGLATRVPTRCWTGQLWKLE